MSPVSRGVWPRMPSVDNVLHLLGLSHPCINVHLLITIGFIVLGLGTLETSTLLPVPIYGCWSALNAVDLSAKEACQNISLLAGTPVHDGVRLWACGNSNEWWQPTTWPGMAIAGVRTLIAIVAGICMDVFGRRSCAIFWMAIYFVSSLARSFAPLDEVLVLLVSIESISAQAASMALILLAIEGSTQKECVRSATLVLMGHSLGSILFVPVIYNYVKNEMFKQLARSIPSLFFVLFIFFLPESFRWLLCRGKIDQLSNTMHKSHDILLEEEMKAKLATVSNEMHKNLSVLGSRGNPLKQALFPFFMSKDVARTFFPVIFISFLFGNAINFKLLHDPMPYQSIEDRLLSCGVAEIIALQLMGLLFARLPVRRVLFSLAAVFTVMTLLTRALRTAGYLSCIADIFFSFGGHFVTVILWTWLIIGVARLTPTHSRGTIIGLTAGFGTLGHSMTLIVYDSLTLGLEWEEYSVALLYSALIVLAGLLVLFLPNTPPVLPDMTSHINPHTYWPDDLQSVSMNGGRDEATLRSLENTRL